MGSTTESFRKMIQCWQPWLWPSLNIDFNSLSEDSVLELLETGSIIVIDGLSSRMYKISMIGDVDQRCLPQEGLNEK